MSRSAGPKAVGGAGPREDTTSLPAKGGGGAAVRPERAQLDDVRFSEKKGMGGETVEEDEDEKNNNPSNAESLHTAVGLTKLYLQVRKCRPGL